MTTVKPHVEGRNYSRHMPAPIQSKTEFTYPNGTPSISIRGCVKITLLHHSIFFRGLLQIDGYAARYGSFLGLGSCRQLGLQDPERLATNAAFSLLIHPFRGDDAAGF